MTVDQALVAHAAAAQAAIARHRYSVRGGTAVLARELLVDALDAAVLIVERRAEIHGVPAPVGELQRARMALQQNTPLENTRLRAVRRPSTI